MIIQYYNNCYICTLNFISAVSFKIQGVDIKKLIILSIVIFPVIFNISMCGAKDSAAKYEGTKYYGDIFKDYDYLPEPINQRHKLTFLNSIGVMKLTHHKGGVYDAGIQYIYRIPRWSEGLGWARPEIGPYFKIMPDKYLIKTLGITLIARFDSPFYIGYNVGYVQGKYEQTHSVYDDISEQFKDTTVKGEDSGIEFEVFFGYDFHFDDWIISPEIKINVTPYGIYNNKTPFYDEPIKPLIQIGLNIGRFF